MEFYSSREKEKKGFELPRRGGRWSGVRESTINYSDKSAAWYLCEIIFTSLMIHNLLKVHNF